MSFFFLIRRWTGVIFCLCLASCRGWDTSWYLDRKWSAEISILDVKESKNKIDKIAIIRSKKRQIYTELSKFMEQSPQIIINQEKIRSLINSISIDAEVDNVSCSITENKYTPFHILAFDSSKMRTAYIILFPCDDGIYSTVWNYDNAGLYWIQTPSTLTMLAE